MAPQARKFLVFCPCNVISSLAERSGPNFSALRGNSRSFLLELIQLSRFTTPLKKTPLKNGFRFTTPLKNTPENLKNTPEKKTMVRMVSKFVSRAEIRLRIHFCNLFSHLRTSSPPKSKISLKNHS